MRYSGDVFSAQLANIAKAAEAANPKSDGDYEENGLLHCGKCGTPKQCKINFAGREMTVACLCKCKSTETERKRAEDKHSQMIDDLKDRAFDDRTLRNATFENDDGGNPDLMRRCRNYVSNFAEFAEAGKGLLLWGNCGTGKTYAALAIANALTDNGTSVKFATFTAIANDLFDSTARQSYITQLTQGYDLLIIDDVAAERQTPWMQEQLFAVVDARSKARKPMIVTTNLTSGEMFDKSNVARYRIFSRLCELCVAIEVTGADRRIKDYIAEKKHYEDLLNG